MRENLNNNLEWLAEWEQENPGTLTMSLSQIQLLYEAVIKKPLTEDVSYYRALDLIVKEMGVAEAIRFRDTLKDEFVACGITVEVSEQYSDELKKERDTLTIRIAEIGSILDKINNNIVEFENPRYLHW